MNHRQEKSDRTVFHSLNPDTVLGEVEKALGHGLTNLCRPLASYINRVYELKAEDGRGLVAKFFRPGRWSRQALEDEQDFLSELVDQEIPVVAPLLLQNGTTLAQFGEISFCVFPKKGGRSFDEYSEEQWLELGRLLGRFHSVGAVRLPGDRITMSPDRSTRDQVNYLLQGDFMAPDLRDSFQSLCTALIAEIAPLFAGVEMIRIHGDCHFSNLIYRPGESFYLIDLDDMAVGPPVQDFWMLLPDYLEKSLLEVDYFLEGYETFQRFDRRTLRLVEPLRAMRFIHYIAWCAHQVAEDGQSLVMPDFGSRHYWEREIRDLGDQLEKIRETAGSDY